MFSPVSKKMRRFMRAWFLMLLGPAAVLLSVEQASPQLSLSTDQTYTEIAEEAKENKQPDADNEDETELMSMSLEELMNVSVVTASKKAEPIDEAPNVMYVITKEQIRKRGYRTLKDIFQIIPGFGVFHKDIQFVSQVRGIAPNDNEKIAFMINGHIINQLTEPEVFSGGVILLDIFDRIEVIVGPGAVLYGGEPLVAIVNMITRQQNYNEIIASAGNFDDYSTTLMFGKQWEEKKHFFAAGTWSKRDGFDAWLDDSPSTRNQNLADMPSNTGKRYPSFVFFGQGEYDDWSVQFFTQNSQMPELHMEGNLAGDDCRRSDYIYSTVIRNKKQWTDNLIV